MTSPNSLPSDIDILIVGSGTAGLISALSASLFFRAEQKTITPPRILLIDKCPRSWAGGNGYFTAGAYRTAHHGLESLLPIVGDSIPAELLRENRIELPAYPEEKFIEDMVRVAEGRNDAVMTEELVRKSLETVRWLKENGGVRYRLSWKRQAYEIDEGDGKGKRWKFWGGLALTVEGGGKGLVQDLMGAVEKTGDVDIRFETELLGIELDESCSKVIGAKVKPTPSGEIITIKTPSLILCAGGFEASRRLTSFNLGSSWSNASVRGTPHNDGSILCLTLNTTPALRHGDFSTCHAVAWDYFAPRSAGDREASNEYTKSGYPIGIMVNSHGKRFVDEGIDMRNYTYAKFGRAILEQPDSCAWQIFDSNARSWLRAEEYRDERIPQRLESDSIAGLVEKMVEQGLRNSKACLETIEAYNAAAKLNKGSKKWDPAVKDGVCTVFSFDDQPPKSNWALPLDEPGFLAVKVTAGITFTFGGLKTNPKTAAVVGQFDGDSVSEEKDIEGLFAAGEIVGGLFSRNYPGGSGLMAGAVWARKAGEGAVKIVKERQLRA